MGDPGSGIIIQRVTVMDRTQMLIGILPADDLRVPFPIRNGLLDVYKRQMLYLAARFQGKGLFPVRHLVVDEAQDVSALGMSALFRVTGTESLTVVGDIRQKIKGREYPSLMDEWKKAMPVAMRKQTKPYELRTSYRSTRQIMEYAMAGLEDTLRCPVPVSYTHLYAVC